MILRILILSICIFATGYVQAQEPVIFKVKRYVADVCIEPDTNILWSERINEICIVSERNIRIAKIELKGAVITKLDNNCYRIMINGNSTLNKVEPAQAVIEEIGDTSSLNFELTTVYPAAWGTEDNRTLSVYEQVPDGSIKLVLTKKYKIPNSLIVPGIIEGIDY